ncbi:hypothetical protein [Serratia sp. (in: enterobacteria)]|uniref:hypothetical protein n=1 Tax=Serratia sp. (in: enterobacteria) TaxID=616 RepID=UPI003988B363
MTVAEYRKGKLMGVYNMMDDFRFIFPQKSATHKNTRPVRSHLNALANTYCLFYKDRDGEDLVNIIHELDYVYDGIIDGKVVFILGCDLEYKERLLSLVRQCIYKKMATYRRLRDYHHEVLRAYPKAGSLCLSLDVKESSEAAGNYLLHDDVIKDMAKRLFNNLKTLALFSHVIAYFWVLLRHQDGHPYLHLHFYFNEKDFNHTIGLEINRVWFNILEKQGRTGSVRHFTMSENFIGPLLTKGGVAGEKCLYEVNQYRSDGMRKVLFYDDYNGMSVDPKCRTNRGDKKDFEFYIYTLSRESFNLPGQSKSLGLSKIKR